MFDGKAIQRLAKWRSVFAAWQLGTRSSTDAECRAVKDHREATILLRMEVNVLTRILLEKTGLDQVELTLMMEEEAEQLSADYSQRFRGMTATDDGISYDIAVVQEHGTMDGWPP